MWHPPTTSYYLLTPLTTTRHFLTPFTTTFYLLLQLTTTFINLSLPLPLHAKLYRSPQLLPRPLPNSTSSKSGHERQFFIKNLQLFSYVYVELAGGTRQLGLVWEGLGLAIALILYTLYVYVY